MAHFAVTLARSGSKGVPDKNILKINNIAISHFPMLAVESCSYVNHLIYSSDSQYYLELAQNFYEEQRFKEFSLELHLRSPKNSDDTAGSWDAINEIVNTLGLDKKTSDITLLSATCPSINGDDIDFFFKNLDFLEAAMSVRKLDYPIENTFLNSNGYFQKHSMTSFLSARQEMSNIYRPDGHIYFRPLSKLLASFPNEKTQLIDLKKQFYSNIDIQLDYEIAKNCLERSHD